MYWTFDVADVNGYYFWVFYYVLHVIGAQFMLNLVLGVLSGEFGKEGKRLKVKEEFLAQKEENQAEVAEEAYSEWVDKGEEGFQQIIRFSSSIKLVNILLSTLRAEGVFPVV